MSLLNDRRLGLTLPALILAGVVAAASSARPGLVRLKPDTTYGRAAEVRLKPGAAYEAAAQAEPYADRFVTVNGLQLHYLDWGGDAKPAMVLLHGIARHAHTFDHIAPDFTRDYHVLAVDMRGHGDSSWSPDGAYLVEDYVKDLEGLLRALRIRRVTLLGNSTGGRVVQVFAGMHPEQVDRLIVEDVGPERPQDIADAFARQVRQDANGWSSEDELVTRLAAANRRIPDAQLRTYVHFGTKRSESGRLIWKRDPNLVRGFVVTELWQYVSKITSPTLYVIGGASRIVPPATQERLKQTLPNVEIVTMPGLGHYPDEDDPPGFLALVGGFLKR